MEVRATHRSSTGKKLYAKRARNGRFEKVQSYQRALRRSIKRKINNQELTQETGQEITERS